MEAELIFHETLHQRVVLDTLLEARRFVWIATANLKDMHIAMARGRYRPILEAFDELASKGVTFRVIHADEPSRPFRATLKKFPRLAQGAMEMQVCSRSHWKMIIVDGQAAYAGSANFTGAGLGVKSPPRRNLEVGLLSKDPAFVRPLFEAFDRFWMGADCLACAFRRNCPSPIS
ncbi:MAG: phospholipase D family protein [Polyangia bacterium]|jgi:phosphatidylserine/phosphatidylglycerophosphate/cardiolipin synthase-like enzyme|nr:phospholipase D family protein [Polyangia bacterium]